ncbi:hypothetical protein EN854_34655, partial [Mesorhizobium sp. M4B.F.Ca.ET.211.01.1.1]
TAIELYATTVAPLVRKETAKTAPAPAAWRAAARNRPSDAGKAGSWNLAGNSRVSSAGPPPCVHCRLAACKGTDESRTDRFGRKRCRKP